MDAKGNLLDNEYRYNDHQLSCTHSYLVPALLKLIPCDKKLHILDLGCGNGSLSGLLVDLGYSVVGIDSSETGIKIAKEAFPKCDFLKVDIYELPYEILENRFDIILAMDVIEHLYWPGHLLKAARRCLKQGGRFIISTPYHGYFKNLVLSFFNGWDRHFTATWDGGHIKFFSLKTLFDLLREEGFVVIEYKGAGRVRYLWKSMLIKSRLK